MYVCIHIDIYVYIDLQDAGHLYSIVIYICMHLYMYVCVYVDIHVYIHAFIHIISISKIRSYRYVR